jgi:hypothetical protein
MILFLHEFECSVECIDTLWTANAWCEFVFTRDIITPASTLKKKEQFVPS